MLLKCRQIVGTAMIARRSIIVKDELNSLDNKYPTRRPTSAPRIGAIGHFAARQTGQTAMLRASFAHTANLGKGFLGFSPILMAWVDAYS